MDVLGQQLYALDAPYSHSPASSAGSSPDPYPHPLLFPHDEHAFFDPAYYPASALQISTGAVATHDPDEETAHPLRGPGVLPPPPADTYAAHAAHDAAHEFTQDLSHEFAAHDASSSHEGSPAADPPIADALAPTGLTRPLTHHERELLAHLDRLKFFLATAPARWAAGAPAPAHPALNRFLLPNAEYVSCVLWGGLYHITGTDIVRALVFRFEAFGRPVRNMKKFEEGVFSDLRNLKPGVDACLEEPKSPFLDLLFKYQCIRTQKKQKVFYWFSVPHDRLFLDALERDLKREKMGLESTTLVTGEPALSFTYDPKRALYEQFARADDDASSASASAASSDAGSSDEAGPSRAGSARPNSAFFSMFSLFEGSPTYKQRRKKIHRRTSPDDHPGAGYAHALAQAPPPPPPQFDRFGRETTRASAGALFAGQARGEFGAAANPDLLVSTRERQRRALQRPPYLTGLPPPGAHAHSQFAPRHHTFPGAALAHAPRTNTQPFEQGTTTAWVCPLLSCGRMFARAEQLRRHARAHAARPYADGSDADDELDTSACEVAVQGPVQEVPGEDGLIVAAVVRRASPEQDALYGEQFLGASPQWPASAGPAARGSPFAPDYGAADFGTSASAPSQRATFDHAALYAAEGPGPGPIRRHRSATPSVPGIRRPYSGAGDASPRAYHPYAAAAQAHSAESSPMAFSVPLRPAHARGASGVLQEQMQMLGLEGDGYEPQGGPPVPFNGASGFRAGSPMQYVAPGYELALQEQPMHAVYDAQAQAQFGQGYYAAYGEVPM